MPIWVVMYRYDGDLSSSTHLTEKGAILTAIGDILEFFGIDDQETADYHFSSRRHPERNLDPESDTLQWDIEKLRAIKDANTLWGVYGEWVERTWDCHDYDVEIEKTMVRG